MIKCENGYAEMGGTPTQLTEDLACIIAGIIRGLDNKDLALSVISVATIEGMRTAKNGEGDCQTIKFDKEEMKKALEEEEGEEK